MAYTDIDDPSVHFQTALYTGNATQRDITNDGNSDLQPDWVWIKCRSAAEANMLYDSTRGVTKDLRSETTSAENTNAQGLQTFNSNGFELGTLQNVNFNTKTMVAWQWKANGGTTASNTDGDITSTVQANTDAGFSIVTYTGTGSAATVGHGLGGTPDFITTKSRNVGARGWTTWTNALAGNQAIDLNGTGAAYTSTTSWNSTTPTSTVISLGTRLGTNENNTTYVAYCFKSIQGYSKIGKYIGNGNANGPFVYTGFKPAWLLVKNASATQSWSIIDNKRNTFNVVDAYLQPSATTAELSGSSHPYAQTDFLSNGFKIRNSDVYRNGNGNTMIYMAFAEHPFVSSEGVPTTAR